MGNEAYTPSDFFGKSVTKYGNTTWIDKPEEEFDKFAAKGYKVLGEEKKKNPYSMIVNAPLHSALFIGQGYADTLRLGQGVKKGGFSGYLEDALRSTIILGPFAKQLGNIKYFKAPKGKFNSSKNVKIITEKSEAASSANVSLGAIDQDNAVNAL